MPAGSPPPGARPPLPIIARGERRRDRHAGPPRRLLVANGGPLGLTITATGAAPGLAFAATGRPKTCEATLMRRGSVSRAAVPHGSTRPRRDRQAADARAAPPVP